MIVKNLLVVGVMAGLATAAAAEDSKANWKVSGKVRMDSAQSTAVTTAADAAGTKTTEKTSEITLNRAQFGLTGTEGADTLDLSFYAHNSTLNTATIAHKFSDMVTLTMGRMGLLAQSWENDYSSTDQYIYSMAGGKAPDNANGVQLGLKFGDHSVDVQALQGVNTVGEDDDKITFAQGGGLSTAIQFRSEINKMIRPLISYTMVKTSSALGTKGTANDKVNFGNGYQTQLGAGVQVEAGGATVDLEYDTVTLMKQKAAVAGEDTSTYKDEKITAIVFQAKYPVGMTTPFIKVISNSDKMGQTGNIGDVTGTNMALGVEHKIDHVRFHAVYTMDSTSEKATTAYNKKVATSGFNLGVTAAM
jgi:hypothetical protein